MNLAIRYHATQGIGNIEFIKHYEKKIAIIFLSIIAILYIFDIALFSDNRFLQVIIGLLSLLSLYILAKKNLNFILIQAENS